MITAIRGFLFCTALLLSLIVYPQQTKADKVRSLEPQVTEFFRRGQYLKSVDLADSILKIAPSNLVYLTFCYETSLVELKDTTRAVGYLKRIVTTHPYEADYLDQYGWVMIKSKKPEQAVELTSRAYSINRDNLNILLNHGHALFLTGKETQAKELYQEASELTYSVAAFDKNQKRDFHYLDSLYPAAGFKNMEAAVQTEFSALLVQYQKQNQIAVKIDSLLNTNVPESVLAELYEKAVGSEMEANPFRSRNISRFLGSLAFYYHDNGYVERAMEFYKKSLLHDKTTMNAPQLAKTLENIAALHADARLTDSALFYYTDAAAYYRLCNNKLQVASAQMNIARQQLLKGDVAGYQMVKDSVLPVLTKFNDHEGLVTVYEIIAEEHAKKGNIDSQRVYLEKAVDVVAVNSLSERLLYNVFINLSKLEMRMGEMVAAERWMLKADAQMSSMEKNTVHGIEHKNNLGQFYYRKGDLQRTRQYLSEALDILIGIRRKLNATEKEFIFSSTAVFATLADVCFRLNDHEGLFRTFQLSQALTGTDKAGSGVALTTIAELQQRLQTDELFLLYGIEGTEMNQHFALAIAKSTSQAQVFNDSSFLSAVVSSEYKPYYDSLSTNGYGSNGNAFTGTLAQLQSQMEKLSESRLTNGRNIIQRLMYKQLLEPFSTILQEKKTLTVIPGKYFRSLPFESLQDKEGKFAGELFAFQYLPSVKAATWIAERTGPQKAKDVLLVGNGVFEELSGSALNLGVRSTYASSNVKWAAAANNDAELMNVKKSYQAPFAELSGVTCTETELKKIFYTAKPSFGLIHISCPAIALNKYQEQSSIVLSQHLTDTVDDGYLTVKEIESMNIPADLVVLSGCSKQANGNDDGYGVHNFSSSFILAGVNAMVLSLWVTTDEAREKFMGGLYEQLRGGVVTTAVAVKQVKERFIRGDFGDEYRNPHYWAPFIYIGR